MKTQNQMFDVIGLENEIEKIAPKVRHAFSSIDGPSERVIRGIHAEAVSHVFSQRRHHFLYVRVLAAAAALVLLMGGAVQYHFTRQAGLQEQTLRLVLHIGSPNTTNMPVDGTTELANRLLNIQGLDEETFFTPGETEVLSL